MVHPISSVNSSVPSATVVGTVTKSSNGGGAWNDSGSCATGSDLDLSSLGGHESWGSADVTDAGNCAEVVWQVLASAECPD